MRCVLLALLLVVGGCVTTENVTVKVKQTPVEQHPEWEAAVSVTAS
jgi:hypothetical protein